jgi:hypothetical protein
MTFHLRLITDILPALFGEWRAIGRRLRTPFR